MIKKIYKLLFQLSRGEKKILIKELFFTPADENIVRLIKSVKKSCKDNLEEAFILDVGAFDGKTSIQLSQAFPKCKIIAFEANVEAYELALKNCKKYSSITIKNLGISDNNGTAKLFVTENKVSSSINPINFNAVDYTQKNDFVINKELTIQTITIDSLSLEKNILILKIDAQGYEHHILQGATNTIKNVWYVLIEMNNHEIYEGSSKYYEIDNWMRSNDFQLMDIIVTNRANGILIKEYDAIYINLKKNILCQ